MSAYTPATRYEELRFGYSLSSLDGLASDVAATALWRGQTPRQERYEVAWSAIVEYLYTAEEEPSCRDLFVAGCAAVGKHSRTEERHRGDPGGFESGKRLNFERYWAVAANPVPSPETQVVEVMAMTQIWPQLTPGQRQALLELAAQDDYKRAAAAVELPYNAYRGQVARARRRFLELWHEGETPSRVWNAEQTKTGGGTIRNMLHKRRASRLRREGRSVPRRKKDMSHVDDADMARRVAAGESIASVARSLGIASPTVHRRIAPYRT